MSFIDEYIRVLKLTRKPKKDEFLLVAKVTGVGLILIGLLGTLIRVLGDFAGLR